MHMDEGNFRKDLALTISGLKGSIARLAGREETVRQKINSQTTLRTAALRAAAGRLLPNMEQDTLNKLKRQIPEFAEKQSVLSVFEAAQNIPIPLIVRIFNDTINYRVKYFGNELRSLQTKLFGYLDTCGFSDIVDLDADIADLGKTLDELRLQKTQTKERLNFMQLSLTASKNSKMTPSDNFRKKVEELAKEMRATPSSARQSSFHGNRSMAGRNNNLDSIILYILTGIPTDSPTFMLWAISDHSGNQQHLENSFSNAGMPAATGYEAPTGSLNDPAIADTMSHGSLS